MPILNYDLSKPSDQMILSIIAFDVLNFFCFVG